MALEHSIGKMADIGHCKVQTIRYYEEIGLLPKPARTAGNQRIYTETHLQRLGFIRHSRELGFSLDQIRNMLDLSDNPNHSCESVDLIAKSHLAEVESKILRLNDMKNELERMIEQCAGNHVGDCRIIEVLSNHQLCIKEHQAPESPSTTA